MGLHLGLVGRPFGPAETQLRSGAPIVKVGPVTAASNCIVEAHILAPGGMGRGGDALGSTGPVPGGSGAWYGSMEGGGGTCSPCSPVSTYVSGSLLS